MGYFGNYQQQAIQKGYVDQEGDYEVMILGTKDGRTNDGINYKQVYCKINAPGEPRISIFLTEGPKFDGQFTAFCDTFGLPRGDINFQSWTGKRGWIHILLGKKDGFINMTPRWILNEEGYVEYNYTSGQPASNSNTSQSVQRPACSVQRQGVNGREHEMQQQGYGQTTQAQEDEWGDIPF